MPRCFRPPAFGLFPNWFKCANLTRPPVPRSVRFRTVPVPFTNPQKGNRKETVEVLYTIMGKGCIEVVNLRTLGSDMVTGRWKDGRTATIRGIRQGVAPYGCTRFGMKAAETLTLSTKVIYRELLKQVVRFFAERKSPVDPLETLEIMAFIEAANQSGDNHGRVQPLATSL